MSIGRNGTGEVNMKNETIINVPEIQDKIKTKHDDFLSNFDGAIQKVAADNRLLTDMIFSRLYRITLCFQQERVIDSIQAIEGYPKKLILRKEGFDNYVHITTNGHMVRIDGYIYDPNSFISDISVAGKNYQRVDEEGYDWTAFAEELLDYIHLSVYARKEALETKISGMFSPSSPSKNK